MGILAQLSLPTLGGCLQGLLGQGGRGFPGKNSSCPWAVAAMQKGIVNCLLQQLGRGGQYGMELGIR